DELLRGNLLRPQLHGRVPEARLQPAAAPPSRSAPLPPGLPGPEPAPRLLSDWRHATDSRMPTPWLAAPPPSAASPGSARVWTTSRWPWATPGSHAPACAWIRSGIHWWW